MSVLCLRPSPGSYTPEHLWLGIAHFEWILFSNKLLKFLTCLISSFNTYLTMRGAKGLTKGIDYDEVFLAQKKGFLLHGPHNHCHLFSKIRSIKICQFGLGFS